MSGGVYMMPPCESSGFSRGCAGEWARAIAGRIAKGDAMSSLVWPVRAVLGFVAAVIATLTFHQAMWAVLHAAGTMPAAPYPMAPTGPLGVPKMVSLCFWAGLYGAVFGVVMPRLTAPLWLCGLALGIIAALGGMFVVLPLKGQPVAVGFAWKSWLNSLLINGFWGIGVGVIAALLMPGAAKRM
jgi:hypothetical protein